MNKRYLGGEVLTLTIKESDRPLFFIYQFGLRHISLPPAYENQYNFDMLDIVTCEDGVLVQIETDVQEAIEKLNAFKGREIVGIFCDTNECRDEGVFEGAELRISEYGTELIYLKFD